MTNNDSLVSTEWLDSHLSAPDIRVVDGSWYLPQDHRHPKAEYAEVHIPGARFFDIDEVCDTDSILPHMLPSAEKFASRTRRLGLGDGNRIVVYDGAGCMTSARVWWMFRIFGHRDTVLLDGGLPKWRREGRPLEDIPPAHGERHFSARLDTTMMRTLDQMLANLESGREQVADARSPGRYSGSEPEPRPGVRGGHIPGGVNVPYRSLLDPDHGTFLPPDKLRRVFEEAGVDLSRPIVTTCGSGITAAVLTFALHLLGHRNTALYDGSWSEWGSLPETPVATT